MGINSFETIVTIIAALLSIFQIVKTSIMPNSNAKVQQNNQNSNNYYTDNSTTIKNTTTITTINNPSTYTSNNNGAENGLFIIFIAVIILAVLLSFYSLIYEIISVISFSFLIVMVHRDSKFPFQSKKAKIHWTLQKTLLVIIIINLSFIPKSILDTINQLQTFQISTFTSVLDSLVYNINFIWNLLNGSKLIALDLIGRILVTFGLLYHLVISSLTKRTTHNTYDTKSLISFILVTLLMLCVSNIEFSWNLAEPFIHNLVLWFDSTRK